MSEIKPDDLDGYISIAKAQMSQPTPMPENSYSNKFVSGLIARIESETAKNAELTKEVERLRELCLAQEDLLVAFRTNDNRLAGKAIDKIAALKTRASSEEK